MVRLLMRYGADPHAGIWPHRDAMAASCFLLVRLAEWLLSHGADPRTRTPAAGTALDVLGRMADRQAPDWSARYDTIGELLLRHDAEITPAWAVHTGNLDKLRELHDSSAATGARPSAMRSVLSMAVSARRPDVVRFLLDLGYDPDERHRLEPTPCRASAATGPHGLTPAQLS